MKEQLKTDFEKILKISNFSENDIKFKKNHLNKSHRVPKQRQYNHR